MPTINIKKYSRSNISSNENENPTQNLEEQPKKRGRPKKQVQIMTENNDDQVVEEQQNQNIINDISLANIIDEEPFTDIINDEAEQEDLFLDELNSNNYIEPPTKEQEKQQEKSMKESMKIMKKKIVEHGKVASIYEGNNDLFDDNGSEIIGRDRRVIINKLNQYRNLFPKELAKFKVKKGSSIQELKAYLDEAQTIVETSSYDHFLTDSILQAIKLGEGASKFTKYDISGCADMLKANPQFNALMKQLYVKYNVFSKIPVEFQLLLLVSTTAYICSSKNKNKHELEQYLNAPLNPS
jgi:hypothetical protein